MFLGLEGNVNALWLSWFAPTSHNKRFSFGFKILEMTETVALFCCRFQLSQTRHLYQVFASSFLPFLFSGFCFLAKLLPFFFVL